MSKIAQPENEPVKEVNRRDFVKSQLAAGFAVSLPGCAGMKSCPAAGLPSSTEQLQEKSKMRMPKKIVTAKPHIEGAGVHLHRGFGFGETAPYDPFLLFDDFRNDDPEKYKNGFPWHPHRGIETIT